MAEEWREWPTDPRYRVSDDGRVKGPSGKVLGQRLNDDGYRCLSKGWAFGVHVLVCEAFHGPKPSPRHEVAHWDGDKTNNRAENLRWATHAENERDKVRHGRTNRGVRNPSAKLTTDQVREIRRRYASGERGLWKVYGIHPWTVRNIATGQRWSWLDADGEAAS